MRAPTALALCAALALVLCGVRAGAQDATLVTGGRTPRSGIHALAAGFTPDPFHVPLSVGGTVAADGLRLGAGCRGFLDRQPDVVIDWTGRTTFLRFFVRGSGGDLTLLVNDASGRWHCNDDTAPGTDLRPMVDVYSPAPGQYDVWIGTHVSGARASAELFVTELRTERP